MQEPASQLLAQHNPTCDLRSYVGGQLSCHHMWSLLDADQEIPCAPTSHHITSHHDEAHYVRTYGVWYS